MKDEFEIITHGAADYKMFVVNLLYRTPHVHKDFEICLLLEGAVRLTSREGRCECGSGSLWVTNPYESHELTAGEPATILSLQISPVFFKSVFPQIEKIEFSSNPVPSSGSALEELFLKTAAAYFRSEGPDALRCVGLIFLLFHRLLAELPHSRVTEKEKISQQKKADRIRALTEYIDSHYREKLLLTGLAGKMGLTMSYLSHFFKNSFGVSFQDYLTKIRCEKARQLLLLTDFSLLDISISCGFSDIKYFYKGFRRQFGCSPRQYRLHFEGGELSPQQKSLLSSQEVLPDSGGRALLEKYFPDLFRE